MSEGISEGLGRSTGIGQPDITGRNEVRIDTNSLGAT